MPPSPMSLSTWSCDPSAQPLGLNELHKNTKTKQRHLPASGCPGNLESQSENHSGQAALIPVTPKAISHQLQSEKQLLYSPVLQNVLFICLCVCVHVFVCTRACMRAIMCKVNSGAYACYVLTLHCVCVCFFFITFSLRQSFTLLTKPV